MAVSCLLPLGCTLGEGPVSVHGVLWFVDIKGLAIHRFDPESGEHRGWPAPAQPGFLAPAESGGFIVGLKTGLYRFDPQGGTFELLFEVEPDRPGNRLNDGAVDPRGRLWFGSMDDGEEEQSGRLYRLDHDGPTPVDDGYCITNGPAFSPDGRTLYHTDTLEKVIHAFDVAADGGLSGKRVFAAIEDGAGYPDGPVVDAEGCLWTGLFAGWAARRYSPAGTLLEAVHFPVANITKLAFGGPDLKTAYATTAAKGLDTAALRDQPLAGGVFSFAAPVAGLPQQLVGRF